MMDEYEKEQAYRKSIVNKEPICPLCYKKLKRRNEGFVCKNWDCLLYHKVGNGWFYYNSNLKTLNQQIVEDMFNTNTRLRLAKEWAEFKKFILRRDNYTCQSCNYEFKGHFVNEKILDVHHLVYVSKCSAMYLDEDNCITLCQSCHKKIHSADKHKFGGLSGYEN